jgi:ArsR family transcriptional regulator, arsenate/arsenite/antimonite-responsive transcriptional repressor / arsenate reductase (thioredoxin)
VSIVLTATDRPDAELPSFLRLAGHPVRWRLLSELARSDLRVGELCARLELSQNLVSYHLGRLRGHGVVASRRSAADGRDCYYTLDLDRCGALLTEVGGALHPGLRLTPPPRAFERRSRRRRTRILFLCTGNSARSQMAEAMAKQIGAGAIDARSAGSHPKSLHPNAVRVMGEQGIDLQGRRAKHLDEFTGQRFDYVVSLCDRVREVCPGFPGHPDMIHWSVPDPARGGGSDQQTYPAFRRTAGELATRIRFLLKMTEHPSTSHEGSH